jgi:protoporphyrinogen oxidase
MFGYVPGGYARILDRLAEVLEGEGVEIRCAAPVQRVESAGWHALTAQRGEHVSSSDNHAHTVNGESMAPHGPVKVRFADGSEETFDRVVFTTPTPIISAACPQLNEDERRRFKGVEYLGIVCSSLLLKKPISPYYVTNITDDWVPLTAIIEITTIVDPADLGGHSLVYLPKYMMSDDPAFAETDDEVRERCLTTLEKMHPHFSRDDVLAFRTSRARCVMALPTIGYSERLPPMQTSIPGVYAVNSAQILKGNLNVNETIQIAEEALATVLAPAIGRVGIAHQDAANNVASDNGPCPPYDNTTKERHHDETNRELIARS